MSKTDKAVQRILREMADLEAEPMPTADQMKEAVQAAKRAVAQVALLKNRRRSRRAEMATRRAQLTQRLTTMSEMRARGIVGQIRVLTGVQ